MNEKFFKTYSLMLGDMDVNYQMTKIAAAKYFQETFARYCAKYNIAAFDVLKDGIIWVISDLKVEVTDKLPIWSENFSVYVWVSEITKMRTFVDFEIKCNEKTVAIGESCFYLLDEKSRRPLKSCDIVSVFDVIDEKVFGEHSKQNYQINGEKIAEKIYEITVNDLDFNFHVNNLSYLGICLRTLPVEFLKENQITSYSVKFLKETYLGNKLGCELFNDNNKIIGRIYDIENNSDVCSVFAQYTKKVDFCRNPREAGLIFS